MKKLAIISVMLLLMGGGVAFRALWYSEAHRESIARAAAVEWCARNGVNPAAINAPQRIADGRGVAEYEWELTKGGEKWLVGVYIGYGGGAHLHAGPK